MMVLCMEMAGHTCQKESVALFVCGSAQQKTTFFLSHAGIILAPNKLQQGHSFYLLFSDDE